MDYAEIYWMIDDQHIFMVLFLLSVTIIFVVKDTVILSLSLSRSSIRRP